MTPPSPHSSHTLVCPSCLSCIIIEASYPHKKLAYCAYCGVSIQQPKQLESEFSSLIEQLPATLVPGHLPEDIPIQFHIGGYQVLKRIGKGGMGEVFLAYDTTCGRRVALKKVRADLKDREHLYKRFVKEARITSQLSHPSIIPIYSVNQDKDHLFYTMPYVEGITLKALIRQGRKSQAQGIPCPKAAIQSLLRPFISLCQAISYAHSQGVLHRDIKPENIILGTFGEVVILDWGLAKLFEDPCHPSTTTSSESKPHMTHVGKVVGTLSYLAPERAFGQPATIVTETYALGVILYQILTLEMPFKRKSLKEYKKAAYQERFINPIQRAPYRDVPKVLASIVEKALSKDPQARFQSVSSMIDELERFLEGRSEWFATIQLQPDEPKDWEFQENVLITEHMAITSYTEETDWVYLMISQLSFSENTAIETEIMLRRGSLGIGFLLGVPQEGAREKLNEGYTLWLSSKRGGATKLLRSSIEVFQASDIHLNIGKRTHIRIEKIGSSIKLYLDHKLQFSYVSHAPLKGTHIGILQRDTHMQIEPLQIFEAGLNVLVSCLSVPDALFAHKDYSNALIEYRRIGRSFPGRTEGREAILRAGVTLIEQAKQTQDPTTTRELFQSAYQEFEKLHNTPYAPLEYLGKAFVHEALDHLEEEISCFELALKKHPKHPLLPKIEEEILYRMHESSATHRLATYHFVFLVLEWMPHVANSSQAQNLFHTISKHTESPPYFLSTPTHTQQKLFTLSIATHLKKTSWIQHLLIELMQKNPLPKALVLQTLLTLTYLEEYPFVQEAIEHLLPLFSQDTHPYLHLLQQFPSQSITQTYPILFPAHDAFSQQLLHLHLHQAFKQGEALFLSETLPHTPPFLYPLCQSLLMTQKVQALDLFFKQLPQEQIFHNEAPFHYFYGLYLLLRNDPITASKHFATVLDTPYPRSWILGSYCLSHKLNAVRWQKNAFFWEKKRMNQQLSIYYKITNDEQSYSMFIKKS